MDILNVPRCVHPPNFTQVPLQPSVNICDSNQTITIHQQDFNSQAPPLTTTHPDRDHCQRWRLYKARGLLSQPFVERNGLPSTKQDTAMPIHPKAEITHLALSHPMSCPVVPCESPYPTLCAQIQPISQGHAGK